MEQGTFIDQVYQIVAGILYRRAAICGQITFSIGAPHSTRQIGGVLSHAPSFLSLSCHRVVNRLGRTVPGQTEQRRLPEDEGVSFRENGTIDPMRNLWRPEE